MLLAIAALIFVLNKPIQDDGLEKCLEVWVNELRLSDFNENGGWAAIGRMT
ncbi:hypothetical protein N9K77_01565 [bacterium]|nr:hypothetical protein [bacterium]